jgi:hypothetical protein
MAKLLGHSREGGLVKVRQVSKLIPSLPAFDQIKKLAQAVAENYTFVHYFCMFCVLARADPQ